jgi:hypothetical protein
MYCTFGVNTVIDINLNSFGGIDIFATVSAESSEKVF